MVIEIFILLAVLLLVYTLPFFVILLYNDFSIGESLIFGLTIGLGVVPSLVWVFGHWYDLTLSITIVFCLLYLVAVFYRVVIKRG